MLTTFATAFWRKARTAVVSSNILWYGLTASLVSGVPILLLPFLVSRLSADQYANIVTLQIIAMFGGLLINLGVDGSVARDALRTRLRHRATHVTLVLGTQLAGFAVLSGVALASADTVERWVNYPAERLGLTLLGCLLQQQTLFTANLFRLLGQVKSYALLSIGLASLEIGLSLVFIYTSPPTWEARLWGFLCASAAGAVVSIMLLWRMRLIQRPVHARRVMGRMFRFGLPTLPHTVFSLASTWADRIILIRLCGAATAGVYAVAAQSVMVIAFLGTVTNLAWAPWLYGQLSSRATLREARHRIVTRAYVIGGLLAFISIMLLGALAAYFVWFAPPAYGGALPLLPWLALGAAANAIYKVPSGFLFFYGRTGYLAQVALLILVLSLVAQMVFVPLYQAAASAIVFATINLIQLGFTWGMALRLMRHEQRGGVSSGARPRIE
jgi:O-antigen/teichoic acid export membrane protein